MCQTNENVLNFLNELKTAVLIGVIARALRNAGYVNFI